MKTPLLIKLDFEDDDMFGGTDAIALVEMPAIETDLFKFKQEHFEFATYTDYPEAVKKAAERGIRLNEKVNNKCATRVGKIRATQLAAGKPISEETIKRMFAYLSRAKEYYNPNDTEACGTISYLLWGGEPALKWSERKLEQIEREREMKMENEIVDSDIDKFKALLDDISKLPSSEAENVLEFFKALECQCNGGCSCNKTEDKQVESFCDVSGECDNTSEYTAFSVVNGDEQMIVSPVMIPNKPILRKDSDGELFYVYFSADTIERMAHKFLITKRTDSFNLEHDSSMKLNGINLVESWVKQTEGDKSSKYGFSELPIGTWFVQLKVQDSKLWALIKSGVVKGLSLEGAFKQKAINAKKTENFVEVKTEGGTNLFIKEETLVTFIVDDKGEIITVAPDGEYILEDGSLLVVNKGKANRFPA